MSKEWTVGGVPPDEYRDIVYLSRCYEWNYETDPITKKPDLEDFQLTLTNDRSNVPKDAILIAEYSPKRDNKEFWRFHEVVGENQKNVIKLSPEEKYGLKVSIKDLDCLKRIFLFAMQTPNTLTPEEVRLFLRISYKKIRIQKDLEREEGMK